MTDVIIVHRYDDPDDKFGVHIKKSDEITHRTVGLFTLEGVLALRLTLDLIAEEVSYTAEELAPYAPIEWHDRTPGVRPHSRVDDALVSRIQVYRISTTLDISTDEIVECPECGHTLSACQCEER